MDIRKEVISRPFCGDSLLCVLSLSFPQIASRQYHYIMKLMQRRTCNVFLFKRLNSVSMPWLVFSGSKLSSSAAQRWVVEHSSSDGCEDTVSLLRQITYCGVVGVLSIPAHFSWPLRAESLHFIGCSQVFIRLFFEDKLSCTIQWTDLTKPVKNLYITCILFYNHVKKSFSLSFFTFYFVFNSH